MQSRGMELVPGILSLIAGLVMFGFTPGMPLYQLVVSHAMSHYIGGIAAITLGIIGLALYRRTDVIEAGVSILTIILGGIFVLDAPGMFLYPYLEAVIPHSVGMEIIGAITYNLVIVIGIIGIITGWLRKPRNKHLLLS
jgi:hypothetical protein